MEEKQQTCKLTIRVTEEEKIEIESRASAAGMTRNDYMRTQALSGCASCSDTKLRCDMVAQVSRLHAETRNAWLVQSWTQMDRVISHRTKEMMDILKEGL